ncbi:ABC transporter ATP-binding protein [Geobacter sp. DSM 9736]|uniref:ABC transporter ATP-binding protein n=1 Tax=Geobacter sp. DSM 9736 TaxID=1277350 RepID=UPI000B509A56|nr:ABC transporter ATP-binding protein [Geobacter sp. DSM 9736]SNB45786.1 phospholipid/cholesterol/gamma-HCH transport system ATP-binding protein [Geobacter sp. DSM 9736]
MFPKLLNDHHKSNVGIFFDKLKHGLSGSIFHDEEPECAINLSNTRGVSIRIEKLNKYYGEKHVLKDVDLEIRPGETFSIIGPSGTGKSVLLKHVVKLENPDSGEIYIDELPIFSENRTTNVPDYRYSMVFQSSALFNSLTVGENVGLWLREKRICKEYRIREIIREKLALVGLEGTETLRTSELSGGMKKRVAIARSLAMNPDLILYDEPTAELDPVTTDELANTIIKLKETTKNTTVIVTHDLNFALYISDRLAMMHDGRVVEVGTPREIKGSSNPIVTGFIYTTTKGIAKE